MSDLRELEDELKIEFHDYALLERALTHRSYINETSDSGVEDNERLEFLGDAVLDFVVGAYLYNRFPQKQEGELTALRAALVRTRTLAGFARQINLGQYLRLGYGEAESGGRERRATLCAAFEAVVGAIYLDQGLPAVQTFMEPLLRPTLETVLSESLHKDAKSEFQVWAQATHNVTPHYEVVNEEGPDHAKTFTVHVLMGDEVWGEGQGRNKREAAQAAAEEAMMRRSEGV
ncbi:MAG TPA: ribonuclease III [Anaerolineae bacterium]|nr:ribonuclease III [Anaerolineae bacterium]